MGRGGSQFHLRWGIRRAAAAVLLCAVALSVLLPGAAAQGNSSGGDANDTCVDGGTNGTNGTGCNETTVCFTDCCEERVRREAFLACKELSGYDISDKVCESWGVAVSADCFDSCANCTFLGQGLYMQCIFYMSDRVTLNMAMDMCMEQRMVFEHARCPNSCVDKFTHCYTPQAVECNAECGNYHEAPNIERDGCACYRDRRRTNAKGIAPDVCAGETVNEGMDISRPGVEHSCRRMPKTCMTNYYETKCGSYTYCDVDLCVVQNVSCPYRGDCRTEGICNRDNGKCYYRAKPDGLLCTDYTVWTHGDQCVDGECVGIEDRCMRYDMDCRSHNPCLSERNLTIYSGGLTNCDTGSGSCLFEPVEDGERCSSDGIGGPIDGRCVDGMCRRDSPNKCENRQPCADLGQCFFPSSCDNYSGECQPVLKPEGHRCTDFRRDTYGDKCIEGRCVGSKMAEPEFQILGEGDCVEQGFSVEACKSSCKRRGNPPGCADRCDKPDGRPVARYYRDVMLSDECEKQCLYDPECVAYSWGYHVCSIYGTKRDNHVDGGLWRYDSESAVVDHVVTCWLKVAGGSWDFLTVLRPYLFHMSVFCFLVMPVAFSCAMFNEVISASYRRTLGLDRQHSITAIGSAADSPEREPGWGDNGNEDDEFRRSDKPPEQLGYVSDAKVWEVDDAGAMAVDDVREHARLDGEDWHSEGEAVEAMEALQSAYQGGAAAPEVSQPQDPRGEVHAEVTDRAAEAAGG